MIDAAVRPTLTPIAVTIPGQYRQSSMIGIIVMPAELLPPLRSVGAASPPASFSIWRLKRSRAMTSIPKVDHSLRRIS
jgi:hypothetical protein